jgi:acetyl esterase
MDRLPIITVPLQAAGLPARLLQRKESAHPGPVVMYLHGGAFVARPSDDARSPSVAQLIAAAGATVVALDYPLAPAHPFPEPLDAAYRALQWLHDEQPALIGPRKPLLVAGEEAGGNLAAALALMARDRGGPALAGQILLSPLLDPYLVTASARAAGTGDAHCPLAEGWHHYLPRCNDAQHPYAAPLNSRRLQGLPSALVVTSLHDGLHDEGTAYVAQLRAAGVGVHECVLDRVLDHDDAATLLCAAFERFFGSLEPPRRRTAP